MPSVPVAYVPVLAVRLVPWGFVAAPVTLLGGIFAALAVAMPLLPRFRNRVAPLVLALLLAALVALLCFMALAALVCPALLGLEHVRLFDFRKELGGVFAERLYARLAAEVDADVRVEFLVDPAAHDGAGLLSRCLFVSRLLLLLWLRRPVAMMADALRPMLLAVLGDLVLRGLGVAVPSLARLVIVRVRGQHDEADQRQSANGDLHRPSHCALLLFALHRAFTIRRPRRIQDSEDCPLVAADGRLC